MNNARDELADVLQQFALNNDREDAQTWSDYADAILAAGYRKPLTIENEKLVIDDGLLLLDVGSCTCSPYGSSHELGCGFEYLDDLTKPLARAGFTRPRTVSTVAELDALPGSTVVKDALEQVFEKQEAGIWYDGPHDWLAFDGKFWDVDAIHLPASVLYEPEGK